MDATAGLFIAVEIAKGLAAVTGVNEEWVKVSDSIVEISKIVRDSAPSSKESETSDHPASGDDTHPDDAIPLHRVSALLLLLAHSEVRVDLNALRNSLRATAQPQRIADLMFLCPDSDRPASLGEITRLRTFNALSDGQVRWDDQTRCLEVSGIVDRSPTALPGRSTLTFDDDNRSAEIDVVANGRDRLRLVYTLENRSHLLPIHWKLKAPVLQILRCTHTQADVLLAEIVVPVAAPRSRGRA